MPISWGNAVTHLPLAAAIIAGRHSSAVWVHFRFAIGLRDVDDLLACGGINANHETVRCWCLKFVPRSFDGCDGSSRSPQGSGTPMKWPQVSVKT